jgi:hypothetical protein
MNLKKLTTLLFAGVTAATPLVTSAQNPTILQGNYVSNVFGQANFVLNPNAQTNVANVAVTNATRTRSTTTPLVATTEFNVTITSANGTATWATRSFDAGMKNQNCEARFSYRGFQATSKAQIKQGANVVAELTLTPSATDPRIASINFPCGDLSAATTFVITDSATLSGVHEIGGIYVGLATNQANVAQAEVVVRAVKTSTQLISASTNTKVDYGATLLNVDNHFDTTTSTFTAKKAGCYKFEATVHSTFLSWQAGAQHLLFIIFNGDVNVRLNSDRQYVGTTMSMQAGNTVVASGCFSVGQTAEVYYFHTRTTNATIDNDADYTRLTITRFPSSSELVVTPETQGDWFISAIVTGGLPDIGAAGVVYPLSEVTNSTLSLTPETNSKPTATLCSGTNPPPSLSSSATTCAAGDESIGITFDAPTAGAYEVCVEFSQSITTGAGGRVDTTWALQETALNNNSPLTTYSGTANVGYSIASTTFYNAPVNLCQIMTFASAGQKAVRLFRYQSNAGTITTNVIVANNSNGKRNLRWKVQPASTKSNSALYVQGPVKGSGTGTAIPAGYQGEVNQSTLSVISTSTTGWQMIKSISLTPGVWLCSGGVSFSKGAATYSSVNLVAAFNHDGTTPPGGGASYDTNAGRLIIPVTYMPSSFGLGINPAVIRVDGSNIYTPWGSGPGSTLYIWFYGGAFTGTITIGSSHTCTRLN